MSNIPPLNALRAFVAAGEHMSFRAAADSLGVTQGAVAQQVRRLEHHLGLALFHRLPRGLSFTSAGRSYHARIQSAFDTMREATATLRPTPSKVLISVTPTLAAKWLIPNLPSLTERHPDIDLRILATERLSSFHSDGIDLAIRLGTPPFGASLDTKHLFSHEVIAVAAPGLVKSRALPLSPNELLALPQLHDTHDLWPRFLKQAGAESTPPRGLRFSQTSLAIDAAVSGQGVAIAAKVLLATDLAEGRLVQLLPTSLKGDGDFYLLGKRHPSTGVRAVRNWLCSIADEVT